jgi:IS30 family transposase
MSYTQLTCEQRYQICVLLKAGHNGTQIAMLVGCHKSTISRELQRNRGRKGYFAKLAQNLAHKRRRRSHALRIAAETWAVVARLVRQDWSPEQISGRLKLEKLPTVSPERIYQYVYADKRRGGTLYRHLRSQKKQRKRYGGYIRRGQIPNRTFIDKRPQIVATKRRFGDWEGDTIIGARHKGAILSATERKSKLTRLAKLKSKSAKELKRKSIARLGSLAHKMHTMTFDNGKEFCEHQAIAAALKIRIYFTRPYCSWQRGLNENTNGLVRQYFPKKYDFSQITEADVRRVEKLLNNRPRKTLGYRTPNEVFLKERTILIGT